MELDLLCLFLVAPPEAIHLTWRIEDQSWRIALESRQWTPRDLGFPCLRVHLKAGKDANTLKTREVSEGTKPNVDPRLQENQPEKGRTASWHRSPEEPTASFHQPATTSLRFAGKGSATMARKGEQEPSLRMWTGTLLHEVCFFWAFLPH